MMGDWDKVKKPYKPMEIKDEKSIQWRTEVQRQEKMNAWLEAARKPWKKTGSIEESRYRVIMEMRNDSGFANIAKKIDKPPKPASMNPPEPVPTLPVVMPVASPVTLPDSLKRKAPSGKAVKQEIIDLDEEGEEAGPEQSDYDPEEDATVKREERANKRRRNGDFATQLKQSVDQEDLELQLEELRLKAKLQEVSHDSTTTSLVPEAKGPAGRRDFACTEVIVSGKELRILISIPILADC